MPGEAQVGRQADRSRSEGIQLVLANHAAWKRKLIGVRHGRPCGHDDAFCPPSNATRRGKNRRRRERREAAEQARRKATQRVLLPPFVNVWTLQPAPTPSIHDGVRGSGPLQKHPSHRPRGDVARCYWPRQLTRDRGAGLGGRKRRSNGPFSSQKVSQTIHHIKYSDTYMKY